MKNLNFTKFKRGKLFGIIFATLAGILLILSFAGIFALILSKLESPLGAVGASSIAVLVLAAAVSSFATVKLCHEGGFISSLISALVISGLMLIPGLIIGEGKAALPLALNALIYIAVSLLFSYLASRKRGRKSMGRVRR